MPAEGPCRTERTMTEDPRLAAARRWLHGRLQGRPFSLSPASEDASFRRYFRVDFADGGPSLVLMDAPPDKEDCRPFLRVAELFGLAGAHVPRIHGSDLDLGFLLLEDLGKVTYQSALSPDTAPALYGAASEALVRIQLASRAGVLPEYDAALLGRELQLFPDWYLARHLGVAPSAADASTLQSAFAALIANNLAQPGVFVHRDYHSRNLMVCEPAPGVLDFQDAVYGPITYDLVSLFKDAYVRWEEAQVLDWCIRYWERARKAGLPVHADFAEFYRDFEWMGVQRHLKVAGIFARLAHRDGKHRYLDDIPLVLEYLLKACRRYRELGPLAAMIERLQGIAPRAGYTF